MENGNITIPLAAVIVAVGGGVISIILAVVGFMAKLWVNDIKKAIDTLFGYTGDLEKSLGSLRSDHEALKAEHKVRHEK
jgi:hypothetical protein